MEQPEKTIQVFQETIIFFKGTEETKIQQMLYLQQKRPLCKELSKQEGQIKQIDKAFTDGYWVLS